MKTPLVEVTWIDSAFNRGWGELNSKRDGMDISECRTVGYMLERNKRSIKLAQHLGDTDSAGDGISIPMVAVKRVRKLR